jgi:hypothetical protein
MRSHAAAPRLLMGESTKEPTMRTKTNVKAGGADGRYLNHNETLRGKGVRLKTHLKAGATLNHNETLARSLKLRRL